MSRTESQRNCPNTSRYSVLGTHTHTHTLEEIASSLLMRQSGVLDLSAGHSALQYRNLPYSLNEESFRSLKPFVLRSLARSVMCHKMSH